MRFIIPLTLLYCAYFNWHGSYWVPKWFVLLIAITLLWSVFVWVRSHWSIAVLFAYAVISGLWVGIWPDNQFAGFNLITDALTERNALLSVLTLFAITSLFCIAKNREIIALGSGFSWLCLIDSLWVIAEAIDGLEPYRRGGLLGNASMNACLIAVMYPCLVFYIPDEAKSIFKKSFLAEITFAVVSLIPILAILLSGSSMALGTITVVLVTYFVLRLSWSYWRKALLVTVLLGSSIGAGSVILNDSLFDSSGRAAIIRTGYLWLGDWTLTRRHLTIHGAAQNNRPVPEIETTDKRLWGAGQGTTQLFLPLIIRYAGVDAGSTKLWDFFFFHSDWFQIFFELGLIGLVLALNAFYFVVRKAKDSPELLSMIVGYAFMMLGNFPLHVSIHAVFGAWLIAVTHKGLR